jgi:hypothetical protein
MTATVISVARSPSHDFSKPTCDEITLVTGRGVEGDAHFGETVKHRSRVKRDSSQPNLRQVHLIHAELIDSLREMGFDIDPGVMGENITTRGLEILDLPTGTRLAIGADAVVEITGLRNPCSQLDSYQKGLTAAVLNRDPIGGQYQVGR